ncbi:uncharacterized protein [Venturia canescens]|uniref:uncharacterized protein isoform X1 n=1 Tax=Venturia canescens TaxID=32260 RepID=UPI001C9CF950|nr:uncharacterized protein LOC122407918 isoform X1 [Venturia canescens]
MTTSTTNEFTATTEEFTSNEEMDEFIAGDETIYFTGYIDSIEGSKLVDKGVKKVLYKFVVNNGKGRKMRVLMWEEVANKYEASLRCKDRQDPSTGETPFVGGWKIIRTAYLKRGLPG